jgi:hypothetical protein
VAITTTTVNTATAIKTPRLALTGLCKFSIFALRAFALRSLRLIRNISVLKINIENFGRHEFSILMAINLIAVKLCCFLTEMRNWQF